MLMELRQAFISFILLFGVLSSAFAEETYFLTFPNDSTLSNDSKIKVEGKRVKIGKTKTKLTGADNRPLQEHLRRADGTENRPQFRQPPLPVDFPGPYPDLALRKMRDLEGAPVVILTTEKEIKKRQEQRSRSLAIIQQAIIPYLKWKSIGNPSELLQSYTENRKRAKKALDATPLTDELRTDDPRSLIAGLNQQLQEFETAAKAVNVCKPLIGAKQVEVSESRGIVHKGELVPAGETIPGMSKEDYADAIYNQRVKFSTSSDSRTRFSFTGPELRNIRKTIEKFEDFGTQTKAQLAAWSLGLGAFDAEIIEIAANSMGQTEDREEFFQLLASEARIVRLGYLDRTLAHPFEVGAISALLNETYNERLNSITHPNLLIEAKAASQNAHTKTLATLLSTYEKRMHEAPENRGILFQLGLEYLQTHPNVDLFKALVPLAISSDERISLFESIQRLASIHQSDAMEASIEKIQADIKDNQDRQKKIIDREFAADKLSKTEANWVQLNTQNPTGALVLLALIRRQIQGESDFALTPERREVLHSLKNESERIRRSLEPQISWLRDSVVNGNLASSGRLEILSDLAKLKLQLSGDWASALEMLAPSIQDSSNEAEVLAAIDALTKFLPSIIEAAYRDQLREAHLQAAFSDFQTFYFDPFLQDLFKEENPSQENIDLVALNHDLRSDLKLSADDLAALRNSIQEKLREILRSWGEAAENHADKVFSSFNEAYEGNES